MNYEVFPEKMSNFFGEVEIICSKSEAHRILICSALSDKKTVVKLNCLSKDISATISCLEQLGAKFQQVDERIEVTPILLDNLPEIVTLDCIESGSTIRFLMPVVASLGVTATFTGSGRLPSRPQDILLDILRTHGVTTSSTGVFPIKISGKMRGGKFKYPGNVSSQYTTGLLTALPLTNEKSTIELTDAVESRPYIDITTSVMGKFGIDVVTDKNKFTINENSRFISPGEISVGGDWSNAAFFLCLGALSEKGITIKGLDIHSSQGDKEILNILKQIGADIIVDDSTITVKKNKINPITIDASQTPDLMPVVCALLMFADGESKILNAERLRIKECDRLNKICEMINLSGGRANEYCDRIEIFNSEDFKNDIRFSSYNDHRMVMAEIIIGSQLGCTISSAEAIFKSYPNLTDIIDAKIEQNTRNRG